ncbi:MAG: flagellar basal body-associated FliL family protein [Gallionellaceae bacterium]|nr:flagellar basal body-associated FliL family protein [Gallionellaceae bacterium]
MATRPPARPAAPASKEEAPVVAPPKSKKKLIITIIVLLLAAGGGAGWYFTQGTPEDGHAAAKKAEPAHEPKFVMLGENFTVNLQREEGDQYLQAGITLKILQPELEEKIKKTMPEIRSKLLFLLSGKLPSELQTAEGKKKLVAEIIAEVDGTLGLAVPAPAVQDAVQETAASDAAAAQAAPVVVKPKTTGVVDVLFTSFIIQ